MNPLQNECFSLLLTIPLGSPFEQDTYLIEHEALGAFYMFVVPVGGQSKTDLDYYEAVIYRRQMYIIEWYDSTSVNGTPPVGGPVTPGRGVVVIENPDAGRNPPLRRGAEIMENPVGPQILPGLGAVIIEPLDGGGNSKTEQEVFYFRPKEIAPPAVSVQKKDPGAAGRRAASKLTMAQAPQIGGLKLGMSMEQVLALFPGIRDDAEVRSSLSKPPSKFGELSFVIKPWKYSTKKKFERVSQIVLTFLDGRVSTLYVGYDGPLWEHVDEFVAKFARETKSPGADSWDAYVGMDTQLKTLKCKDFEISVFAGGNNVNINYVQMRDMAAQQKLKERRARAKAINGVKNP